jgi:hypothetical protein
VLERDIEGWAKPYARKDGWYVRKVAAPGRRSMPDDVFKKKRRRGFYCEFKATGCEATDLQKEEHRVMRAAGYVVYVCDSRELFAKILTYEDTMIVPAWIEETAFVP